LLLAYICEPKQQSTMKTSSIIPFLALSLSLFADASETSRNLRMSKKKTSVVFNLAKTNDSARDGGKATSFALTSSGATPTAVSSGAISESSASSNGYFGSASTSGTAIAVAASVDTEDVPLPPVTPLALNVATTDAYASGYVDAAGGFADSTADATLTDASTSAESSSYVVTPPAAYVYRSNYGGTYVYGGGFGSANGLAVGVSVSGDRN
jgi:hypothetical protein